MKQHRRLSRPPWHWMSFTDSGQFLGVVLVRARSVLQAIQITHRLKINPGGEVADWEMPEYYDPPEEFQRRLLSKADITRLQGHAKSVGELQDEMENLK